MKKIIECVPNFSEGRDMEVIAKITDVIRAAEGVQLLDVDPGAATNRTVVTFVGDPDSVVDAAFHAIKRAAELIDMSKHSGEHPRFGATDVCPLIPIANVSMEEAAEYAHRLGKRVGEELGISIYCYENAASKPDRVNLATVRSGEYEGLVAKLAKPEWKPDYGPAKLNVRAGATAISARDFLVAYNINLNTTSTRRANSVAFDVREAGRVKREGNPITGKVMRDADGEAIRIPGKLKAVKAIGWFIEEYGVAQISMNLTNISITSIHEAFEAVNDSAVSRGMRVTGSELVGLVPLNALLDAGKYFLKKQERSVGIPESEIIKIAVKSLGLDELAPFDPAEKIIEYKMAAGSGPLMAKSLANFADETASESPAPGGGSIAAYVGALGVSLGVMVANLSAHKRGWDDRWDYFSDWAEKGMKIKSRLEFLVDEDTAAFNRIIDAVRMPKASAEEKATRLTAMNAATHYAITVPLQVMETALESFDLLVAMGKEGNPNSASDAGVGALCARAAIHGAWLNVLINCKDLEDQEFKAESLTKGKSILDQAIELEAGIMQQVEELIS
ncbi:glutamate formimidoyltransferase [Chitinophagales bacterium]|nr:glutamate formimidoyltransferase [Chitinophagales bacterium]